MGALTQDLSGTIVRSSKNSPAELQKGFSTCDGATVELLYQDASEIAHAQDLCETAKQKTEKSYFEPLGDSSENDGASILHGQETEPGTDEGEDEDEDTDDDEDFAKNFTAENIDVVRERYQNGAQIWHHSPTRKRLRNHFLIAPPAMTSSITNVACLALGTIADPYSAIEQNYSAVQLAALLDMVAWLEQHPARLLHGRTAATKIKVYAQDPSFTDLDEQLLADLGITIVRDNGIWNLINRHTLLYAPHLPYGVIPQHFCNKQFTSGEGPAMMIWNRMDAVGIHPRIRTRRLGHLVKHIEKGYTGMPFPRSTEYRDADGEPIIGECWVIDEGDTVPERTDEGWVCIMFRNMWMYQRNEVKEDGGRLGRRLLLPVYEKE